MKVWRVFEEIFDSGKVRQLGMSNCYDCSAFACIYGEARIKPAVLQNRFHAKSNYDEVIRRFCRENSVIYQSFWTLTANPHLLQHNALQTIAKQRNATPEQILFRFVMDIGIVPLTGTTSDQHMRQDLDTLNMSPLDEEERDKLQSLLE